LSQLTKSQGSQYTDIQRREAAAHYTVLGNITKTADLCGIPARTINDWKLNADWWVDLVAKIRDEQKDEIDANLSRILRKSTAALEDRIDHGDEYITKDGSAARKAVSARDLSIVTGVVFDKRQIMRNLPTSIKAESTDARLDQLAQKLRDLQGGTVVIDQTAGNSTPETSPESLITKPDK